MNSRLARSAIDINEADSVPRSPAPVPLHVLTLTPFFPALENEVGGCFVEEPIYALTQTGVSSTVIAVRPLYHARQHASPSAPAKWIRYPQWPGTFGLSSAGRLLYARLLREISRLHRERPIRVIHAHAALPCGQAAWLLARRFRIPYVVTIHGLDVFNTCFRAGAPAEWRRRASIAVYQNADDVVCVSRKAQQILQSGLPVRVPSSVVYNGTDVELFSPQPASQRVDSDGEASVSRPEILVVGNLIPSKGQELVLRAIHRIADFPELQCRIIGEGSDRQRLEALANDLGIRQRIHFMGRQNRVAVADAMRRSAMFVLPSRNEGLGCVYLEAMACARPVIACRGQGIEEIVEHQKNGWLISPDNLDELEQAILTLLRSPELSLQIGQSARQTVLKGLTLSHQAQQLAAIYREISGARQAA